MEDRKLCNDKFYLEKNIKIQREISSYVHCLRLLGYGYLSVEKWLLRFGEVTLCIFRLEIVETFVNGGSELSMHE